MTKKIVACCVAVTMLAAALRPAMAVLPLPPPTPAVAASQATLGVAGGAAVGIIAAAAILCIVDYWQKLNGLKNWDGSPKVVKARGHRR